MTESQAKAAPTKKKVGEVGLFDSESSVFKALIDHIRQWRRGAITGLECAQRCATRCKKGLLELAEAGAAAKVGSVVCGVVGGVVGTGIGGPVGGGIGGAIGTAIGKAIGGVIDWLVKTIFGKKRAEDLQKAYQFLGVPNGASMTTAYSAFKQKALTYKPKEPDCEKAYAYFAKLHTCIALIGTEKRSSGASSTLKQAKRRV